MSLDRHFPHSLVLSRRGQQPKRHQDGKININFVGYSFASHVSDLIFNPKEILGSSPFKSFSSASYRCFFRNRFTRACVPQVASEHQSGRPLFGLSRNNQPQLSPLHSRTRRR